MTSSAGDSAPIYDTPTYSTPLPFGKHKGQSLNDLQEKGKAIPYLTQLFRRPSHPAHLHVKTRHPQWFRLFREFLNESGHSFKPLSKLAIRFKKAERLKKYGKKKPAS